MASNEQAILEAAERLLAETGKIPTVEAVREAVGGGSFSTISPVLREWRKQHQSAALVAGEIPARVREALERAASSLWGAFREEVEERIDRAREEADIRAGEAESERDQALAEVARLEAALTEATQSAARAQEDLTAKLEDSRAALSKAREEIATLTERTAQQEGRIEGLGADMVRAHADRDALHRQLSEQAGRYDRELEQARERAETLSQKLDAERQARQTAEASAADLRAENARLAERAGYVDELRGQVKALQDRLAAPANQNRPEAPAKPRSRKRGGPNPEPKPEA